MDDENLAQADEALYENGNLVDNEPFYENFAAIQNDLRRQDEQIQINTSFQLINRKDPIERIQTEPFHLNEPSHTVGNSDCRSRSRSSSSDQSTTCSVSSERSVQQAHTNITKQYFQNWYCDRYLRAAPPTQYNPINHFYKKAAQKLDNYPTSTVSQPSVNTMNIVNETVDEESFENRISRMYGFDDADSASSASSRHSSVERGTSPIFSERSITPRDFKPVQQLKPKQITIREYFSRNDLQSLTVNGSIGSPSQRNLEENCCYGQVLRDHPDVLRDPDPEIIRRSNPDDIIYNRNVTIRYLCPPTPPPPGPLIIREILRPCDRSPSPLVIEHDQPEPPTPPPLILREIPPTPPPPGPETKIITKVVARAPPPPQRLFVEHMPALPPKPQSIIIEKWLPYKPQPPRAVIYERVVDSNIQSEFQPADKPVVHRRRGSRSTSRAPIPVHIERHKSFDCIERERPISTFDEFARSTQQELECLQQRSRKQIHAQQQWLANQQQHMNMCALLPLVTPPLVINHAPVTKTANLYTYNENFQQPFFCAQPYMYPSFM
ncbi:unnamed protein product [Adineta ricciae]|uniref:Uncharacterized protein n=1 Tax=Adineta ricciae TaxID=249248 RepID=A0A815SA99_ADIRI|nr:unnamed protein product [Adineta ricciae]